MLSILTSCSFCIFFSKFERPMRTISNDLQSYSFHFYVGMTKVFQEKIEIVTIIDYSVQAWRIKSSEFQKTMFSYGGLSF